MALLGPFSLALTLAASPARAADPAPKLSATGLYADFASKTVDPANELFTPQYPLWSDAAEKTRWIRLPPGARIDAAAMDRWVFPVGTRFWKEFSFRDEGGKLRRVETRYIEKLGEDDWTFASYQWNADETEATLVPQGGAKNVFPIGGGLSHDIPSLGECRTCHSRGGDRVLGFDALQLSNDAEAHAGPGLDLAALAARGLITRAPASPPKIAGTPAARAARGYLHGNCGHCHNEQGFAFRTGLFMRYQAEGAATDADQPLVKSAVGRRTAKFKIPGIPVTYRVKPGDVGASAVWYRMSQRSGVLQMPPAGTKRPDPAGLAAVKAWIEELTPVPAQRSKLLAAFAARLEDELARTRAELTPE